MTTPMLCLPTRVVHILVGRSLTRPCRTRVLDLPKAHLLSTVLSELDRFALSVLLNMFVHLPEVITTCCLLNLQRRRFSRQQSVCICSVLFHSRGRETRVVCNLLLLSIVAKKYESMIFFR